MPDKHSDIELSQGQPLLAEKPVKLTRMMRRQFVLLFGALLAAAALLLYASFTDTTKGYKSLLSTSTSFASPDSASSWIGRTAEKVELPHTMPLEMPAYPVNETLGFGGIYTINMPHRLDRRTEIMLMAAASKLKVNTLPGFNVLNKDRKGLPWINPTLAEDAGAIGCYMSHLDFYSHVVEQGLSSALVFEDDVDWDVNLKPAIASLQQAVATLAASMDTKSNSRTPTSQDPWSTEDWDILYLGYCGDWPLTEKEHPGYVDMTHPPRVLYPDPTVANLEDTKEVFRSYLHDTGYPSVLARADNATQQDDAIFTRQRLLSVGLGPVCTNAYAVSQRGARRLLYRASRGIQFQIDVALSIWCRHAGLRCLVVVPAAMGQWKMKDNRAKDSDIVLVEAYKANDDKLNHDPSVGHAEDVRRSVRKALGDKVWQ